MFGCFKIEEIRGNDNETGLKEEGEIEIENLQVLSIYAMHSLSLSLKILTTIRTDASNRITIMCQP